VGESVYVPASAVAEPDGVALVRRIVLETSERSVIVDVRDGESVRIASSRVHRDVSVLVLTIGDLAMTELTLLEPLARSVLQYFRLLLPDDQVRRAQIRTRAELETVWNANHGAVTHIVLVAHGRPDALHFVDPEWVDGSALDTMLGGAAPQPKEFLSLACQTGRADFAKTFSRSSVCSSFIAPFQNVHGAVASQFCQMYFTARFLGGSSVKVAFRSASKGLGVGAHFRLWQSGKFFTIDDRR